MAQHYMGEGWSERNKIPTVQGYREEVADMERQSSGQAKPSGGAKGGNELLSALQSTDQFVMQNKTSDGHPTGNAGASAAAKGGAADAEAHSLQSGKAGASSKASSISKKSPLSSSSRKSPKNHEPEPEENDEDEDLEEEESDKPAVTGAGGGEAEKERIKKQSQSKPNPLESFKTKSKRKVHDPVTDRPVIISDGKDNKKIDPKDLDSRYPGGFSNVTVEDRAKWHDEKFVNPKPAQPTSVLLYPFPEPADTHALKKLQKTFHTLSVTVLGVFGVVWLFSAFGHGWLSFFLRTLVTGGAGVAVAMLVELAYKNIEKQFEEVRAGMQKQRGQSFSPPTPESVEWLNAAVACIWKQMNPEMFVSMLDMVEDIMQSSLPSFVESVKISDFGLGEHPLRLIAMRGLADVMTDPDYPRKMWIEKNEDPDGTLHDSQSGKREEDKQEKPEHENDPETVSPEDTEQAKEDEAGDFLNMEVSFCYSAIPGETSNKRAQNIHMLVEFFLGAFNWVEIPLPVWVQIERIVGTVRLRAQIVSEPPFLRNLTFSLMGVPMVGISAIPMLRVLPNVLDLPLISNFVQTSIAAAANMYVAPKSMTMNMTQMLSGDGVKKDTDAVGVLVVHVQYGDHLNSQDANGKSDPYCVLSFAKFGRPLYATRIVFEDLNPVWEEVAFLLVTQDDLRSEESLSLQLWDSDKRTADDIVGRVNKPLREISRTPNRMMSHFSDLMGFEDADTMEGKLKWSVGFFEKTKLNPKLREQRENKEKGKKSKVEQQADERKPSPVDSEEEAGALSIPPDPEYPSGVLSVIVKHISNLENREVEKGVKGSEREGSAGQDVDRSSSKLPSSYCELLLNDQIFYKTRVKQYSNMPFFNAGTEVFVRDWTKAKLNIVVRDARVREHDPIMGIVDLQLANLFDCSSQVEQTFSLQDGVGYGKVYCSLVFKSVKLTLPPELRGFDTVILEITNGITVESSDPDWQKKLQGLKMGINVGEYIEKLPALRKQSEMGEGDQAFLRIPVYDRYKNNVVFQFGRSPVPIAAINKPEALAILPLAELVDEQLIDVTLPILHGPDMHALSRNTINAQTKKTHNFQEVGTMSMRIRVVPGFGEEHREMSMGPKDRHEFEVWERLIGLPQRAEVNSHAMDDGVITRQERKSLERAKTQELHMRHRGAMGYGPIRTAVWAKDGLRERVRNIGDAMRGKEKRDQTVQSET